MPGWCLPNRGTITVSQHSDNGSAVVTGAFGFSGRYITRALLKNGWKVRTLTSHPDRPNEFGDSVQVCPFDFNDPEQLTESMRGAEVLYNTYWIRFAHGQATFQKAVDNSRKLMEAAKDAGIRRIVHVSITNPGEDSFLPYFQGKAVVERIITESGLSYAILRPAVIFGDEGILINNIAWFLKHLPAFIVPGSGRYKLQPVFVEDMAALAVGWGAKSENAIVNAAGPEVFEFDELVRLIRGVVHSRALIFHLPPSLALLACRMLGLIVRDVVLTPDEIVGLMQNLLVPDQPPTCPTRLSEWLRENANTIGRHYLSELKRHY